MQIVIDINNEIYKEILSGKDGWSNYVHGLIRTGTPLPEGHGNIVDIQTLIDIFFPSEYVQHELIERDDLLAIEPIIDADVESEELNADSN